MRNNFVRKGLFKISNHLLPRHCGNNGSYQKMSELIGSNTPFMVARFGAVEIKAILYSVLPPPINICLHKWAFHDMNINAGFFPVCKSSLKQFAELMLADMSQLDVLASWRPEELFFKKELDGVYRISLGDLQPTSNPLFWSKSLKGKRVLVVHPFTTSIEKQYYDNREKIFEEQDVLPEFAQLQTIKAVQTIAGNDAGFKTWFDALNYMKEEIYKRDFDIALIGCGAYGFPLAAHVKRMGKQAIHMGGVLQLLFGIKGKRWNDLHLYNEYWVSPSESERPSNLKLVEQGCYW